MNPRSDLTRREALVLGVAAAATAALPALGMPNRPPAREGPFKISLAQWSLHRTLQSGKLDHLDFPKAAKQDYGIDAIEYVNAFFKSHKPDYVADLRKRCEDLGVRSLLIMCD